jgi:hypothetical protein
MALRPCQAREANNERKSMTSAILNNGGSQGIHNGKEKG